MPVDAPAKTLTAVLPPPQVARRISFVIPIAMALFFQSLSFIIEAPTIALLSAQVDPGLLQTVPDAFWRARIWIGFCALFLMVALPLIYGNEEKPAERATFSLLMNLLVVTRALQFPYCIDDAYIYFQYVRNIVEHLRPEYELGSRAVGFTSHLHMILLTVSSSTATLFGWSVTKALPLLAQATNTAIDMLSATALFVILRRLMQSSRIALLGLAIFALSFFNIGEAYRGKESCLLVLLLCLSIWASCCRRPILFAWTATMVVLTRPEGILFFAVALPAALYKSTFRLRKHWLPPLAVAALVFGFLYIYFGTIVPQGMLAKAHVYRLPAWLCCGQIEAHLAGEFFGVPAKFAGLGGLLGLSGLLTVCGLLLWKYSQLRVYLVSTALVTVFFCAGNALMTPFPWYFAWWSLLPPLVWCSLLKEAQQLPEPQLRKLVALAILCLTLLVVPWNTYQNASHSYVAAPIFSWDVVQERVRLYEEAAQHVNSTSPDIALLATTDLVNVGYPIKGRVLDLHGMTDPEMLKLYPVPPSQFSDTSLISFPPAFAQIYQPERILVLDTFVRHGLLVNKFFLSHYQLDKSWPCQAFGSDQMLLFKKIAANRED